MTRRWRARTLIFPTIAAALLATTFIAASVSRTYLLDRLDGLLPPDEIAAIAAEFPQTFLAAIIAALLLAVLATTVIGALVVRPLLRLRRDALARARGEDSRPPVMPVTELQQLAGAIELMQREGTQRSERLARERDEFAVLVASVSEGIIHISGAGRVMHANPAARSLLGLPDHVDGQAVAALVRNVELRTVLERAAAGSAMDSCEVSLDDRRLLVAARPLAGRNGRLPGGIVVALADLTELRRLESVRRDFVANVSHELKTPLTSIRGYVETLMTDDLPAEMRQQFLEVVQKNAARLHRIVDDLLDLSRLESGGWRPELQSVDPGTAVEDAWSGFAQRAAAQGIEFAMKNKGGRVLADPAGLRQVLVNIFDNAIRYTAGGGRITVTIAASRTTAGTDADLLRIEVTDTGVGIPIDSLPRIFERFYRVDPARSRAEGGTGLGLSIVRHLVERMGGDVSAISELGHGTTMRVDLPALPVATTS